MRLILSEKDKHIIVTVLGDYATEIDRQATKSKEDLDTYRRIERHYSSSSLWQRQGGERRMNHETMMKLAMIGLLCCLVVLVSL